MKTLNLFLPLLIIGSLPLLAGCVANTDHISLLPDEKPVAECLPFAMPSPGQLRQCKRKVFAHYFVPFPISIDNLDSSHDQYTKHITSPSGFGNRYVKTGGKARQRPLPRKPRSDKDWLLADMRLEVRRAADIGLDGFAADIVSDSGVNWKRYVALMQAASLEEPDFKIMLMAGMPALFNKKPEPQQKPERMAKVFLALAKYPSAYRRDNGRLVISAFRGNDKPPAWWQQVFDIMAEAGEPVSFVPLIQPWWDGAGKWQQQRDDFLPIVDGISTWGPRWTSAREQWTTFPKEIQQHGKLCFQPVGAQDMRAKSCIYWEAGNTRSYRALWEAAIEGGADWVQVITWNDYSEATEVSPSSGTQFSLYDLTAYYTTWFKLGHAPEITRDVLFYSHRAHSIKAQPDQAKQPKLFSNKAPDPASDEIECLVFAKAPGTLRIKIGEFVTEQPVRKGLSAHYTPVREGTPEFTLLRNGQIAAQVTSKFHINNKITYQNLLYHGGSSTRQE